MDELEIDEPTLSQIETRLRHMKVAEKFTDWDYAEVVELGLKLASALRKAKGWATS